MIVLFALWLAAAAAKPSSSLAVTVSGVTADADVTLERWDENDRRADVAHRRLARGQSKLDFGALDAGTYAVVVRGDAPLAVSTTKINVGSGQRQRVSIAIRPLQVDGSATFAGQPLPGATLAFANLDVHWKAEVKTDDAGRFHAELWQPGKVLVTVSGGALRTPFTDTAELRGGRFDFAVPDRQVRGRITDAASGRGVPNVLVFLRSTHGEVKTNPHTQTDDDGAFLFNAVAPGEQHLTVMAADYVIPDAVDFVTKEGDPPHRVDVALDTGAPRALRVVQHDGHPAAGAEIDAVADGVVRAMTYTDADGRAAVPLPRAGEAKIYVIPRSGAFAVVGARDPDRVELPRPASSLRIVTRSTDGAPLPDVELLMSFNGTVVPPVVARRIAVLQGLHLVTNAEGEAVLRNIPAGWYQFWPYRGDEEAAAILAASSIEAPIALNVKTGENTVAVDFQKRH